MIGKTTSASELKLQSAWTNQAQEGWLRGLGNSGRAGWQIVHRRRRQRDGCFSTQNLLGRESCENFAGEEGGGTPQTPSLTWLRPCTYIKAYDPQRQHMEPLKSP